MATLSPSWRDARGAEEDFAGVEWNRTIEVPVTTMDALIERFGMPAFVKVDVEGAEPDALAGLSHPVPVLSFEYLRQALDLVAACTGRLLELGDYRFTWSPGESFQLATAVSLTAAELIDCLAAPGSQRRSGDVYAVLKDTGLISSGPASKITPVWEQDRSTLGRDADFPPMGRGKAFVEVLDEVLAGFEPACPEQRRGAEPVRQARVGLGYATPSILFFDAGLRRNPDSSPSGPRASTWGPVPGQPSAPLRPRRALSPQERAALAAFAQLGADIGDDFTHAELRSIFRLLALRYHPDRHPGSSEGEKPACRCPLHSFTRHTKR